MCHRSPVLMFITVLSLFFWLKLLDGYNFSPSPMAKFLFHSCHICGMWQWKLLIDPAINSKQGKQKGQNNYKNCDSTKEKEMICQAQFSRPKPSPWSQVRSNKTLQHSHASWACSQIHLFHFHTCPAPPSSTKNLSQSQSDVVPLKSAWGPIFHFSTTATKTETKPDWSHTCRSTFSTWHGLGDRLCRDKFSSPRDGNDPSEQTSLAICTACHNPRIRWDGTWDVELWPPKTVRQMQGRKPYICNQNCSWLCWKMDREEKLWGQNEKNQSRRY